MGTLPNFPIRPSAFRKTANLDKPGRQGARSSACSASNAAEVPHSLSATHPGHAPRARNRPGDLDRGVQAARHSPADQKRYGEALALHLAGQEKRLASKDPNLDFARAKLALLRSRLEIARHQRPARGR